jgi:hypothetical protein
MQHNRKVITTPMTTITRSKANTTAVWLLFKIREQVNMTYIISVKIKVVLYTGPLGRTI